MRRDAQTRARMVSRAIAARRGPGRPAPPPAAPPRQRRHCRGSAHRPGRPPAPGGAPARRPAPQTADQATALQVGPALERGTLVQEDPVGLPGTAPRGAELGEHRARVLPGPGHGAEQRAMAGPGGAVESGKRRQRLRPGGDSGGDNGRVPGDTAPPPPRWTCTDSGQAPTVIQVTFGVRPLSSASIPHRGHTRFDSIATTS
jgi:hypothetical protein